MPGRVVDCGDIDGRLKTLFDGLRMPHDVREMYGRKPQVPDERCYCLLEDDILISKLSVSSARLLSPDRNKPSDIELMIGVKLQAVSEEATRWGIERAS